MMLTAIKNILYFTITNVICLIALIVLFFGFEFDFFTSLVLTFILGAFLYQKDKIKNPNTTRPSLERVSPEKEAFYQTKGLTKDEMNLFRKTMYTARIDIYEIEKNTKNNTKLLAITSRNHTMPVLKDFFKHIVEQPNRLHDVNTFLYTQLPNLRELTSHYIEINSHLSKTKETYQTLAKSAEAIDALCQQIESSYRDFMANDLNSAEIEIELAKYGRESDNNTQVVKEPSETEL